MPLTPRPLTLVSSAALLTGIVLATPAAASQEPHQRAGSPSVALEVAPAGDDGAHAWHATFTGAHLRPADGDPRIEWVVDSYASDRSPWPVTVAEGAAADPVCQVGTQRSGHDVASSERADLRATTLPAGTDRVLVFGSYCAVDGSVHRFQVETYLHQRADGTVHVEQYPLEDDRVRESHPRPQPGPQVDTGLAPAASGPLTGPAALTGSVAVAAGGALVAASRRRA